MNHSYDCIVIGGGPAGSTAAALIAEAGFSTLLLEREKMPRFHVGESLMPESYWVLQRLGVLEKMKRSNFVKKVSVQFVSGSGKESQPFFFKEHDPRECSETWQVTRAEFDKMLFDNAAEKGADCYDRARVRDVLMSERPENGHAAAAGGEPLLVDKQAAGVRVETAAGTLREILARVIIDATGQQSLLASRLGLREDNPNLRKAAIWGYYKGARREPGEHGGATIIMHTVSKESWFWYIPLENDVTSIGVVSDNDYLLKGRGSPEDVFEDELVNCPGLTERLMDAALVSKFRVAKEFSYTTRQHAGYGWVLVGDAFGFIDPIYSSGVFFAMRSGELAADAVIEGLRKNDVSPAQLSGWCRDFSGGVKWIRKLVDAYYTNEFSFGAFMRDHPEHRGNLTDLLIGRIFYRGAGRIFDDLDPRLEEAKKSADDASPNAPTEAVK